MTLRSSLLRLIVCTIFMILSLSLQAEETVSTNESINEPTTLSKPAHTQTFTPVLDGKLDEWQASALFNSVTTNKSLHKNNRLDWQKTWLAHDNDNLYIAYHNQGRIPKNDWWAWEVYLDTDHNPKTGYSEFNHLGADYLLQGNELYQYVGDANKAQSWDKIWKYIGYAHGQIDTATEMHAELSIPLKWLKLDTDRTSTLNVLFYGDNEVFGGEGEDRHQATKGYFSYAITATAKK